ncbi:MAG: putative amidohydrolase [Candidatus Latescibacterota bacterium]|jgi:predicted amidohydrolase
MRIALAQIPVVADVASNVETLYRAVDFAAKNNADILLTPEGSLSGYTHQFDTRAVEAALRDITATAKAARLGLALGTCFVENDDRCYNQIRFYDKGGTYLGFHSKTLTCGSLEDPSRGEIEHYAVAPLSTYELDGVRVGALICNDLWANPGCTPQSDPHLSQQLARMGAHVIFHAVNGGRSGGEWSQVAWQYHESNLRMRARAGSLYIATVDNSFPADIDCSSPSGLIDPQGNWLCRSESQGEHFLTFEIEI